MNIKGLDYNTQRAKLIMSEYGREIQKMVEYACELPTKEERLQCAKAIIRLMETKNPQLRDSENYEQSLWDHLSKPQPMKAPKEEVRLRHYGKLVGELFKKLKEMPAGEERDALTHYTANQMKRDLALWGHGSMDDEKVADDLAHFTDGVIQLDLQSFKFEKFSGTDDNKQRSKKKK